MSYPCQVETKTEVKTAWASSVSLYLWFFKAEVQVSNLPFLLKMWLGVYPLNLMEFSEIIIPDTYSFNRHLFNSRNICFDNNILGLSGRKM